jgi:SAM-dependent methyltransferase
MNIQNNINFSIDQIVSQLIELQQKPELFTPGEALFWDDPHISEQMLKAHLDPNIEAASRRPETIDRSVKWMIETLALKAGDSVLDLGCGPGLYASRFARAGLCVTGVDYSRRSIEYATKYAKENNLEITYRYQNYLELSDENQYDVALLIYGDFCPLNPEQRATLLRNVYRALKPNGKFVLDVSTRECRRRYGIKNSWHALESGFCKPGPHLLLEDGFEYPEQSVWLDQFVVIEADGNVSVYRNWFQDYTPETITEELSQGGFCVDSLWGDLTGQPYTPDSEWIGLVTRKES